MDRVEQEREAFEAGWSAEDREHWLVRKRNGDYVDRDIRNQWIGFQRGRSSMPVTEAMVEAGAIALCRVGAGRWDKLMPHIQAALISDARACLTAALSAAPDAKVPSP